MLKAIHAQEDHFEALSKAKVIAQKLRKMKLGKAAEMIKDGVHETLALRITSSRRSTGAGIRTNNPLERIMREIRQRTRVVGNFPDGKSALMLVAARFRHISGTKWGTRKYLDVDLLKEVEIEMQAG